MQTRVMQHQRLFLSESGAHSSATVFELSDVFPRNSVKRCVMGFEIYKEVCVVGVSEVLPNLQPGVNKGSMHNGFY